MMILETGRAVFALDALVNEHMPTTSMGERLTGFVHIFHLQTLTTITFIIACGLHHVNYVVDEA